MIKEKYEKLLQRSDKDTLDFIGSQVDKYRKYVNSVVEMEIRLPIARIRMEDDELRDFTMKLDRNRRICHEAAIDACCILNRICGKVGLEPFYEGDIKDRYQVADFCLQVVTELFNNGQKVNITQLARERKYIDPIKEVR